MHEGCAARSRLDSVKWVIKRHAHSVGSAAAGGGRVAQVFFLTVSSLPQPRSPKRAPPPNTRAAYRLAI
jgi:hypothetical protein